MALTPHFPYKDSRVTPKVHIEPDMAPKTINMVCKNISGSRPPPKRLHPKHKST